MRVVESSRGIVRGYMRGVEIGAIAIGMKRTRAMSLMMITLLEGIMLMMMRGGGMKSCKTVRLPNRVHL